MKKSEAINLVQQIARSVQKARSNIQEATEYSEGDQRASVAKAIDEDLFPHLFGQQGELWVKAILKMADKGDTLQPIDLYNLCMFTDRLEPVVGVVAAAMEVKIPKPSISMMRWDPE